MSNKEVNFGWFVNQISSYNQFFVRCEIYVGCKWFIVNIHCEISCRNEYIRSGNSKAVSSLLQSKSI